MARLTIEEVRARRPRDTEEDREARAALKKLTDKLVKAWIAEHLTHDYYEDWPDLGVPKTKPDDGIGYTYYEPKGSTMNDRCIWTTRRMFDGKFWAMRFSYHRTGVHKGNFVLVKSSLRRRAKRMDAKEIASRYWVASGE